MLDRPRPRICCLDLDTFFVSVERLLNPALDGQPVIVGGRPGQRGVVTACSYEVRRLGVRSGMSLTDATRLAPHAIFLPTRHGVYEPYARQVRAIAARFSPEIQVASIDEMYMSFEGCERLYRDSPDEPGDETIHRVVGTMVRTIRDEIGLPASAGIATTRSTAKIACGLAKPAGVVLIAAGDEPRILAPLSVRKLPGIGPVTEARLAERRIATLGQLAQMSVAELRPVVGAWAESVRARARGEGLTRLGRERPAFQEFDRDGGVIGSISNERTFREDVGDHRVISSMLCALSERVCWRARKRGVKAKTVSVKLRYTDFRTITRSKTIEPTDDEDRVHRAVRQLYGRARQSTMRVRLLGVALSNLSLDRQLTLMPGPDALNHTIDEIRARFGYDSVRRALGAKHG